LLSFYSLINIFDETFKDLPAFYVQCYPFLSRQPFPILFKKLAQVDVDIALELSHRQSFILGQLPILFPILIHFLLWLGLKLFLGILLKLFALLFTIGFFFLFLALGGFGFFFLLDKRFFA